jgi:hypothetical protein
VRLARRRLACEHFWSGRAYVRTVRRPACAYALKVALVLRDEVNSQAKIARGTLRAMLGSARPR